MKNVLAMSVAAVLFTPAVFAQNANFQCPSDWNCFPKTIIACPIGFACIRYSDGYRIDTQAVSQNSAINTVNSTTSNVPAIDYSNSTIQTQKLSSLADQIKANQAQVNALSSQIHTIEIGSQSSPDFLKLPSLKQQLNYYSCLLGDEYNQVTFIKKGQDPANRALYNCDSYKN